jgi:Ni,Fe-hydrogenase I small subunit
MDWRILVFYPEPEAREGNIVTCLDCTTDFSEEADKLLQCERCFSWSCIKCAKVNPKEYEIFRVVNVVFSSLPLPGPIIIEFYVSL